MKKFDSMYSLVVDTKELPPILNLSGFIAPRNVILNILQFNCLQNSVSMADSVIMIMPKQSDSTVIYKNSMIWTVTGLKIRGGKINSDGLLVNEDEREYLWDFGPLHLEIT